jgi:CubicO group peptidase (beta-lactamase class C family)
MKKISFYIIIFLPIVIDAQKNYTQLLDQYLQAQMKVNAFSGSVLVMKQNKVLLKKGYGFADREWNIPNTPQAKFRIASITKQFTATCILQLIEQGKLHFDDKLSKFYPDFPKGDSVTITMLLNHTSGIPIFTSFPDIGSYEMLSLSNDSMINYFKNRPYDFSPGTRFRYNNSGYLLLGCILEKVTGQPIENYLRKNILDKLGMMNTGNDNLDSILPLRVRGYRKNKNASFLSMEWPLGGGSMYSTVEDLYKWDRALYTTSLLSNASKQMMFTPGMGNYGYGFVIDSYFGHYRIHHGGGINGFTTSIERFPLDDVCIIILCNHDLMAWQIVNGMSAILFNQGYELPLKHRAISIDSALTKRFIGKYRLNEPVLYCKEIELVRKGSHLFLHQTDIDIADFPLEFEFKPASANSFFNEDWLLEMEFVVDKNGNISQAFIMEGGVKIGMEKIK